MAPLVRRIIHPNIEIFRICTTRNPGTSNTPTNQNNRQERVMRQLITGMVAAAAVMTVSAAPASACGGLGLFSSCSPCGGALLASSCSPCGVSHVSPCGVYGAGYGYGGYSNGWTAGIAGYGYGGGCGGCGSYAN